MWIISCIDVIFGWTKATVADKIYHLFPFGNDKQLYIEEQNYILLGKLSNMQVKLFQFAFLV